MAQWKREPRRQGRYLKQLEQFATSAMRRWRAAPAAERFGRRWADMMKGTEAALKSMQEAFENAAQEIREEIA